MGEDLDGYSISLGGSVILFGTKGDGSLYKVGINDPFDNNKLLDKFELSNVSLVTSGNYERYFELGGRKYHHIIDSSTLYPSFKYSSVTVIYEDSSIADALSTALFCLDVDESKRILANYLGIQAILVTLAYEMNVLTLIFYITFDSFWVCFTYGQVKYPSLQKVCSFKISILREKII